MKQRTFGIAVLVALALALAGCGQKKEAAGTGAASPPAAAPQAAAPSAVAYESMLSVADVEKVTGLTGVTLVPRDPSKGAGGDLNFATPGAGVVLMALFTGSTLYEQSKAAKGYLHAMVPGLGDEAFDGPQNSPVGEPYVIYVRKGAKAFSLSAFFGKDGKPTVSQARLRELAKGVVEKL